MIIKMQRPSRCEHGTIYIIGDASEWKEYVSSSSSAAYRGGTSNGWRTALFPFGRLVSVSSGGGVWDIRSQSEALSQGLIRTAVCLQGFLLSKARRRQRQDAITWVHRNEKRKTGHLLEWKAAKTLRRWLSFSWHAVLFSSPFWTHRVAMEKSGAAGVCCRSPHAKRSPVVSEAKPKREGGSFHRRASRAAAKNGQPRSE
ncbi:uncharacterized protein LOC116257931 [Nymphaea colorata]|uniref:uncharacterized protein LOC116257931 n=1 Tax=Nymphaea colorata TaxID=210225 RepID=UPI00129E0AEE|nr:uncharacterized protein LOC116257931 [Nymphaea colorata]